MTVKVGDKVNYVPDITHALEKGPDGEYPWVIGVKRVRRIGGRPTEEVEELEGKPLNDYIAALRRSPKADEERKKLIFVRPNTTWPATVTAVNDDGTVNLDIKSNVGGVTLHYNNIKLDENAEFAHSFRKEEERGEREDGGSSEGVREGLRLQGQEVREVKKDKREIIKPAPLVVATAKEHPARSDKDKTTNT